MVYDEKLVQRILGLASGQNGLAEKRMFGGVGFLVNGNMACGVHGSQLIVRLSAADAETALSEPHVHVFDMTGRPMKGWITLDPEGIQDDRDLEGWVQRSLAYAAGLPKK